MGTRVGGWWPAATVTVATLVLILLVFRETAFSIVSVWKHSETFSHGFVILPIVAALVWHRRRELAELQPRPWPWALVGVLGAVVVWLVGAAGDVAAVKHFALAAMFPLVVWAILGHNVARALLFPLGYLFFAVPVGEFLILPLMVLTADATVGLVRLSGIPVYREALEFSLPTGNWSVVEACSGVRYLIASLALGALYAHLMYRSFWRRVIFIAVSAAVPIGANILRAYMIVMIGHHSDMEHAVGVDHLLYGWVFFAFVVFVMFLVGRWWREDSGPTATPPLPGGPPVSGAGLVSQRRVTENHRLFGVGALAGTATAAVLIAFAGPVYAAQMLHPPATTAPAVLAPEPRGGWVEVPDRPSDWRPAYQDPIAEYHELFSRDGQEVRLFIGYYRDQLQRTDMLHWNHRLAPSGGTEWRRIGQRERSLRHVGLNRVTEAVIGRDRERILAWRWYWVDGHWTTSRAAVKAYTTWARLRARSDDSAVIVVYAAFEHTAEEIRERLEAFAGEMIPSVRERLRRAHIDGSYTDGAVPSAPPEPR